MSVRSGVPRGRPLGGLGLAERVRAARRSRTRSGRRRLPILAAALVLLGALLAGGWLWLRDSTLVAVHRVEITGLSGPDVGAIRASLTAAARSMTTLDVQLGVLHEAVSPYPEVKRLQVSTQFPHGMRIAVTEQVPVAVISIGSQPVPVAADGTLLRDATPSASLPTLAVGALPGGTRIEDPVARAELSVLGAAPYALLARAASVSHDYWHGVVVQLRQGPSLEFGSAGDAPAKWSAVEAMLAAPANAGASYIDVSDPARPAAGPGPGSAAALSALAGSTSSGG
jgi:cell division protein FtsQ